MDLPLKVSNTLYSFSCLYTDVRRAFIIMNFRFLDVSKILTYSLSGCMHRARLLTRVQGVVVQAIIEVSGSLSNGKLTIIAGS
ncbi:unnamed protein product [Schistosoma mattheei]|uniref:Uncharacterized protein n=1 Tax=Schistosoma mattheei TaxID=31246 RepID=A0A183PHD9_9TREM|nr:unnamed protein product [Schistosoma mattheei]